MQPGQAATPSPGAHDFEQWQNILKIDARIDVRLVPGVMQIL